MGLGAHSGKQPQICQHTLSGGRYAARADLVARAPGGVDQANPRPAPALKRQGCRGTGWTCTDDDDGSH
jgi:hypothetical protein